MVLTMCQFEKQSMETKIIFTLIREMDEFKENDEEYPIEVRNILDFSDLWPIESPNKLPLMHDIELATNLSMTHNYFDNYQFISPHWKVFQVWYLYEIAEVQEILRSYLTIAKSPQKKEKKKRCKALLKISIDCQNSLKLEVKFFKWGELMRMGISFSLNYIGINIY